VAGEAMMRAETYALLDAAARARSQHPDQLAAYILERVLIGSVAAFEDHLMRFPNCIFAGLAKVRIESREGGNAGLDKSRGMDASPVHPIQIAACCEPSQPSSCR
jgi:hypothetical protein